MQDQFDEKLSSRISDVFDNYEDSTADYGWTELRKRFPGEERRKVIPLWWRSAAAVAVLAIGALLFLTQQPEPIPLAKKTPKKLEVAPPVSRPDSLSSEANATEASQLLTRVEQPVSSPNDWKSNNKLTSRDPEPATGSPTKEFLSEPANSAPTTDSGIPSTANLLSVAAESPEEKAAANSTASGETVTSPMTRSEDLKLPSLAKNKVDLQSKKASPFDGIKENDRREPQKSRQVSVGVYAGSYVTYAEGSESSINTGVGISSEIGLSRKLKLSTGIALAQNTLRFNSLIPENVSADFIAAKQMEESETLKSGFGTALASTYSLDRYNATLLGLDVPLNLKYILSEKKGEVYVVAGLSSNLYLDEKYKYLYEVSSEKNNSFAQEGDDKANAKLKNFDFARMLNLSVGFGRPVGKQSRLSFEPFVKYPLGGQGSRDIRFGSAGMNLKLNFSGLKSKN